jgi:demethylmenaquinone methyltransferase / 2-methoxy-6-polyprenyl-1,4-benzoquinol methylase
MSDPRNVGGIDASPEQGKIRQMFDDIAGSYDRLNTLMTAGLHHRWREMGVMLAGVGPGSAALDVCCGTGDFAFALRRAVGREGRVVGCDISDEMLKVAREKSGRNQLHVDFRHGDVLDLPFSDGEFDACTVGFGIRNVPDIQRAFSEMRRVSRPEGRVVCLEITQPQMPVFKQFYGLWFNHAVPVLGRLAAGDESAYAYLPASVKRFPAPDELKSLMQAAGLRNVRYQLLAGGIIAVHYAIV